MTRTIVDIPDEDLQFLAELCAREKISRAEAVRRAVREYRSNAKPFIDLEAREKALNGIFGMWKGRNIDSVEYQRQLRAEWDHRGGITRGNRANDLTALHCTSF